MTTYTTTGDNTPEIWLSDVGGHANEARDKLHDLRLFVEESPSRNVGKYLERCDRLYHIIQAMQHQAQQAVESARKERHLILANEARNKALYEARDANQDNHEAWHRIDRMIGRGNAED